MSDNTRQLIGEMHAEYVKLTGLGVSLMGREWCWFEWIKRGLTVEDLRLLVREKQRRIRAGEIKPVALVFRYLVGSVDVAEEDVLMLRAKGRYVAPDKGLAEVLRATGREDRRPKTEARSADQVVARVMSDPAAAEKALAELQKFKNSL